MFMSSLNRIKQLMVFIRIPLRIYSYQIKHEEINIANILLKDY
jgi:hypothetical protein